MKRTFTANGIERDSIDDTPADVRDACRKAAQSLGRPGAGTTVTATSRRNVIDGTWTLAGDRTLIGE